MQKQKAIKVQRLILVLSNVWANSAVGPNVKTPAPAFLFHRSGARRRDLADDARQIVEFGRLHQMMIETGFGGFAAVFGLAESGVRDQDGAGERWLGAQHARQLITVDVGQADVEQ